MYGSRERPSATAKGNRPVRRVFGLQASRLACWTGVGWLSLCLVAWASNTPWEDAYGYGDLRLRVWLRDSEWRGEGQGRLSTHVQWTDRTHTLITAQSRDRLAREQAGSKGSGRAGAYQWHTENIDWGPSYLAFEHIALLPLSIRGGRLSLHEGEGLLLSGTDDDWLLDGALASYDGARWASCAFYAHSSGAAPSTDVKELAFLRTGLRSRRVWFAHQAFYCGLLRMKEEGKPWLAGYRTTLYRQPLHELTWEGVAQTGRRPGDQHLLAGLMDTRWLLRLPGFGWRGRGHAGSRWTFASGSSDGTHDFQPLLHHNDFGHVYNPELSNIHILSAWFSWDFSDAWSVESQAFHYTQAHIKPARMSRGRITGHGYDVPTNGQARELGTELNARIRWQPRDLVGLELLAGRFFRGSAYGGVRGNSNASEIRAQVKLFF